MDTFYMSKVFQDSNMIFVYVSIIVVSFLSLVSYDKVQEKFIVMLFTLFVIGYYYRYTMKDIKEAKRITMQFDNNEENTKDIEFVLSNVYSIHKNPVKIRYIYHHQDILNIINKLAFLKKYDNANYEIIVSLIETFLRYYYNILDNKLDCKYYHGTLKDIRAELLNRLSFIVFNTPSYSNKHNNIYETLDTCTKQLTAFMLSKLKIIANICRKNHTYIPRNGPYPSDNAFSVHEMH